jgi:hypothetical protein
MATKKPLTKQRTARSAAALVGVLIASYAVKRWGLWPDLADEVALLIEISLGAAVVYYRQKVGDESSQ